MLLREKLRTLRKGAGLTQDALAEVAGVTPGSVRRYEQGQRFPTFQQVVKIAAALGTDCLAFADCDDVGGPATTAKGARC